MQEAAVTIVPKVHDNVLIRIPRWIPEESLHIAVNGKPISPLKIGDYLYISKELLPGKIIFRYALPVRTTVEKTMGTEFRYTWRGDEITGVSPNTDLFPFYPSHHLPFLFEQDCCHLFA